MLEDPGVSGLSSFIGVDGSNTTLNSGRMFINFTRSSRSRSESVFDVMARLRPERADDVAGIEAWFQPVQELSIEDQITRTQYRFTLTAASTAELAEWVPKLMAALQQRSELVDVASDLHDNRAKKRTSILIATRQRALV